MLIFTVSYKFSRRNVSRVHIKISSVAWKFAILPRFLSCFLPFELPAEEASHALRAGGVISNLI